MSRTGKSLEIKGNQWLLGAGVGVVVGDMGGEIAHRTSFWGSGVLWSSTEVTAALCCEHTKTH